MIRYYSWKHQVSNSIRVFIADDHAVLRAGLKMLLDTEPDMEVIGDASNGQEALIQSVDLQPDVILLDITMPHMSGLEVMKQIIHRLPQTRILILTMHDDESYLREALAAGGAGYVLKQAADTELLSAIRVVYQGGTYLHQSHKQTLLEGVNERKQESEQVADSISLLSPREQEVLRLLAMGYTNQQAADQLFLSIKTVETYKARLMNKLDLHSRAELVCYALAHGLMENE
jgi:two-component system, NarL family, response regulator NreC